MRRCRRRRSVSAASLARDARAAVGASPPAGDRPCADARRPTGGLVLPLSSKYLIDEVLDQAALRAAGPDCARRAACHGHSGAVTSFALVADSRRRRAARDHRHAQARAGAHHAPARALFRFDANRRAGVAHHERCGRPPQSRRHRPGAARRRHLHGGASVSAFCSTSTGGSRSSPSSCWPLFGGGMAYAFKTLRPLFRERGKINAEVTGRLTEVARRHSRRQELHGGKARRDRLCSGRPSPVPQHRQVDDRRVGDDLRQHRHRRPHQRGHDLARRTRHPRRADDARRLLHVHLLHRPRGRAVGLDCVDRHADHRGVCRARSHPRDSRHADGRRPRPGQAAAGRHPRPHRVRRRVVRVQRRPAGAEVGVIRRAARHDDRAGRDRADRARAR